MNPFAASTTLLVLVLATQGSPALGAQETFQLDPARSSLTLSGTVLGNVLQPQGSGSLTTTIEGTLVLERLAGTVRFPGGSTIDPRTNGVWRPLPNGGDGGAPADFAARASTVFATAEAALRNLLVDVVSNPIPIQGDRFDASVLTFEFPSDVSAALDYRVSGFLSMSGSLPLATLATNRVTTTGSIAESGGVATLTIPLSTRLFFSLVSDDDVVLDLQGTLVATRAAAAPLAFTSINVRSNLVTLGWLAPVDPQPRVESSSDLGSWQTVNASVSTQNGVSSLTTPVQGPFRFYRLAQ